MMAVSWVQLLLCKKRRTMLDYGCRKGSCRDYAERSACMDVCPKRGLRFRGGGIIVPICQILLLPCVCEKARFINAY